MNAKTGLTESASPEMARRIRDKDWSRTRLGAAENWPATLKLVVKIMLASGFPMAIRWGPEFLMLYNDGYRAILGDKHPDALGLPFREAWPEVQDQLAPLHQAILAGDSGAYFAEDFLIKIQRHGRHEDARFTVSYSPIADEATPTGIGGVLITAVETTNRVLTEEALRASERALKESEINLRLVLDSATDGIYCVDGDGLTTMCNVAFLKMIGLERESDAVGRSLHEIMHQPDGSRYRRENSPVYKSARDGTPAHADNEMLSRADGSSLPVEYWVNPIWRDGRLQGAVCTVIDITARKRAEEHAELVLNEMHHRVKNIVGTLQAIATQTFRTAPEEERRAFSARIQALANAYDLLVIQDWEDAIVSNLVSLTLAPFQEKVGERFTVGGPEASLNAAKSLLLVMALHELGTNAAKYGALSTDQGQVDIRWHLTEAGRLTMEWRESGGPPVRAPSRRGFGSVLIERGLQGEQGKAQIEFAPSGVVCTLEIGL